MSRGDRSTETNLEGMIWARTTAKDARSNGWPQPPPLQPAENHPGPGRGHTKKPHEKAKAGNRSDYLVARIARDRPDILEWMKAGEFTSVREAAREAGIIKDVSLVTQVVRMWEKATPEERQAIRQRLAIATD
jgi:hypothetical protein